MMENKSKELDAESVVSEFLDYINQEHGISRQELSKLFHKQQEGIAIPLEILGIREIGCMEAIVKYLKENKGLSYERISLLTGRSRSTVGVMYYQAKKKLRAPFSNYPLGPYAIPIEQIESQKFSALESVVLYLLGKKLRICQIAGLLNRDYRTIYTVYRRGKKKNEK